MKRKRLSIGEYGYRNQRRNGRLALVLLFLALILIQILARFFVARETLRVLLTVSAILTVLPMANIAAPLLASIRFSTPEKALYERGKSYEGKMRMLYDLILTTKESVIPLDLVAVHPSGCVIGLCPDKKLDTVKAGRGLAALFSANHLSEVSFHIFTDEKRFWNRLDNLKPASAYPDEGLVDYSVRILKALNM